MTGPKEQHDDAEQRAALAAEITAALARLETARVAAGGDRELAGDAACAGGVLRMVEGMNAGTTTTMTAAAHMMQHAPQIARGLAYLRRTRGTGSQTIDAILAHLFGKEGQMRSDPASRLADEVTAEARQRTAAVTAGAAPIARRIYEGGPYIAGSLITEANVAARLIVELMAAGNFDMQIDKVPGGFILIPTTRKPTE